MSTVGKSACHTTTAHAEDTDWVWIVELYDELVVLVPFSTVPLNRAVAVAAKSSRQSYTAASVPGGPMTSAMFESHTPMAKCKARTFCDPLNEMGVLHRQQGDTDSALLKLRVAERLARGRPRTPSSVWTSCS